MQTITGKFLEHLPVTEGDSQHGHWKRGGFVIQCGDEFPRNVAFSCFGEERLANIQDIQPYTIVQVNYVPESRKFNERWFTDLRCIGVNIVSNVQTQQ